MASGAEKPRPHARELQGEFLENEIKEPERWKSEIDRLGELEQRARAVPESDVLANTPLDLRDLMTCNKDMPKAEQKSFFQQRFELDVAITWLSFAVHVIDIEATLKERRFAGYMVSRFAHACHDAWGLVFSRRLAQNSLAATREGRLRAGQWFCTNENLVRHNFRAFDEDFGEQFEGLGGLEKIMLQRSSKSKFKPTTFPAQSRPSGLDISTDFAMSPSPFKKRRA